MKKITLIIVVFSLIFQNNSADAQIRFEYSFEDSTIIKGDYYNDPGKTPTHLICFSPINGFMAGSGEFLGYNLQYIYRNNSKKFYSITKGRGGYFSGTNSFNSTPSFEANSCLNLVLFKKDKMKEKKVVIYRKPLSYNSYNAYFANLPVSKRRTFNLGVGINYWKYNSNVRIDDIQDNIATLKYVGGDLKSLGTSLGFEYELIKSIKVVSDHSDFINYKMLRIYTHLAYSFYNDYKLYEVSHPTYSTSIYTDKTSELQKSLNATYSKIGLRMGFERVRNIKKTLGIVYGAELCFIPQYVLNNVDIETRSEIGGFSVHVGLTIGKKPW